MHSKIWSVMFGLFEHSQPRRHRRDCRGTAHHVFTEGHVHVSDRKENKHVKHRVMDRSDRLNVTEERENPAEIIHPTGVPPPSLSIKSQTGDDDDKTTDDKHRKHC